MPRPKSKSKAKSKPQSSKHRTGGKRKDDRDRSRERRLFGPLRVPHQKYVPPELVFLGVQPQLAIRGSYKTINLRYGPLEVSRDFTHATIYQIQIRELEGEEPPSGLRVHTATPSFYNTFAFFTFENVPVVGEQGGEWQFEAILYNEERKLDEARSRPFHIVWDYVSTHDTPCKLIHPRHFLPDFLLTLILVVV